MSNIHVLYPPQEISFTRPVGSKIIFLAGSIEMGKAIDWQHALITDLTCLINTSERIPNEGAEIYVLNPRRPDWKIWDDNSINNPEFVEQVEWELNGLRQADIIVMYLAANTVSPISLLELGLNAESGKMLVFCEEGYSRKGNVDVVCRSYGIAQVNSRKELLDRIFDLL